MKKAEGLALGMSGMLTGVSRLFAPLVPSYDFYQRCAEALWN